MHQLPCVSRAFNALLVIASTAAAVSACSPEPARPTVQAGPMPAGGAWQGVYFDKSHGELNLVVTDRRADGAWRTPGGVRGTLWGKIDGNTLHYSWTEHRKNQRGQSVPWFGRGYFVYRVVDGKTHVIVGEWGLDASEVGTPWKAIKRLGAKVNLDAVGKDDDNGGDGDLDGADCYDGCDDEE